MKKMKQIKRLQLSRETVRRLDESQLDEVRGGTAPPTFDNCTSDWCEEQH